MRVYGNSRVHAPNFNRLAEECVVFENAYVTQPICTPSRSSVLTGLWPHTNGCNANDVRMPADTLAFPELLADPDYRTGYMGKWHLGDEIFPQHGFEEWEAIEDNYPFMYGPERDHSQRSSYYKFLRERGYEPDLPSNQFSRDFASRLRSSTASRASWRRRPPTFSGGTATSPFSSTSTSSSRTRPTGARSTTSIPSTRSSCRRATRSR